MRQRMGFQTALLLAGFACCTSLAASSQEVVRLDAVELVPVPIIEAEAARSATSATATAAKAKGEEKLAATALVENESIKTNLEAGISNLQVENVQNEAIKAEKSAEVATEKRIEADKVRAEALDEVKEAEAAFEKDTGLNATREEDVIKADKAAGIDKEKVTAAAKTMKEKMNLLNTTKADYLKAKQEFTDAEQHVATLTGTYKKHEAAVAAAKKTIKKAEDTELQAMAAVDSAMNHVDLTAKRAQKAKEDADAAAAKKLKDEELAKTTRKKADEMKAAVNVAKKAGTLTEKMELAAKSAEQDAQQAKEKLQGTAQNLEMLNTNLRKEVQSAAQAAEKAKALKTMLEADKVLSLQLVTKRKEAEDKSNEAETELKSQEDAARSAKTALQKASQNATAATETLKNAKLKVIEAKSELNQVSSIIKAEDEEKRTLQAKHAKAIQIDTPDSATVQEATSILDQKSSTITDVTSPLLATIAKEKNAVIKRDQVQKEISILQDQTFKDQAIASVTSFTVKQAKAEATDEESKADAAQKKEADAKKVLREEKTQEHLMKVNATIAEEKVKNAEDTVVELQKEELKKEKEVQAAAGEAKKEEQVGENTKMEVQQLEREMRENPTVVAMATPGPTVAPTKAPTASPTAPTSAPTSLVAMMMAPAPINKCVDHAKFKKVCPYLPDHCGDFRAMKIYCKGTCKHCDGKMSQDVAQDVASIPKAFQPAAAKVPSESTKRDDVEKDIDALIPKSVNSGTVFELA